MIHRFKKSIEFCAQMLFIITRNDDNFGALQSYQLFIIGKIKQCEKQILKNKKLIAEENESLRTKRPSKEEALKIKKSIKARKKAIDDYHQLIYIWKNFGDAIAFHYCDKYAIKHLLYTENYEEKRPPGFITGKEGSALELKILKHALKSNVPAVLCDITNTIRHGDICLLGMNDPHPIEIKSSKHLNERGTRQIEALKAIGQFFQTDEAENFRQQGGITKRIEMTVPEENHQDLMNELIGKSYKEGTAAASPEEGLWYIAITGKFKPEVLDKVGKYIHLVNLNEFKSKAQWHPYTPFALTIEPQHVYNFIYGNTSIYVCLDFQVIKRRFKEANLKIIFLNEANYYAQVSSFDNQYEGLHRISTQSFLRLAFEFQSLTWLISQRMVSTGKFFANPSPEDIQHIPPDWLNLDDGIPLP